jgi:quercetin dioxygenase-like cupin family protein
MKVTHFRDLAGTPVEMTGAHGVTSRIPISADDGAPNFTMRVFTLEPGGQTPYHRHDYEHEIFILNGRGTLLFPGGSRPVRPGDTVLVEADDWHGFRGDDSLGMEMICLVPNRAYLPGQFRVEAGLWAG